MHRPNSLKTTALVSVTAAATLLVIQACGGGAVAQASDANVIEGVWDTTVTAKDCASGATLGTPFKTLLVFRRGGTFDVDIAPGRSTRGNVYGAWKQSAGTTYTANAVHHRFNPDTTLAGSNRIQRALTLAADANAYTATLAIQVFDTAGATLSQACATEAAVRLNL